MERRVCLATSAMHDKNYYSMQAKRLASVVFLHRASNEGLDKGDYPKRPDDFLKSTAGEGSSDVIWSS